jgi:monovalent cation:H+ antiporter-2, CPA2 family
VVGWVTVESLFVGECLGISSTMLVARAFEDQQLRGGFVEVVLAILVFEDMLAIMLLAVLTAVGKGAELSPLEFAGMLGQLLGFFAGVLAIGLLIVPRFIRGVVGLGRGETTLIAGIAICFGMAALAHAAGYSVALGAFLAGMLVAESGEGPRVEHVIRPLRDVFAAIFFVSIGVLIDPSLVAENWLPVLVLTLAVLVGKIAGVSLGGFLVGNGVRNSLQAGMSMAQIGEFSFIIATLGLTTGATRPFVFPVAVAVACLTAWTTPWLVRHSAQAADTVQRRMPARLQTFVTFYESWIEQLRTSAPRTPSRRAEVRTAIVALTVEAILLTATIAGTSLLRARVVAVLTPTVELSPAALGLAWTLAGGFLALLLLIGMLRRGQALARALVAVVLPAGEAGKLDLGSAPRRAFTVVLELGLMLAVGLPLVAILQPFLPLSSGVVVLALMLSVLAFAAWRSITNLEGHVRAGSELIVEMLARQSHDGAAPTSHAAKSLVEVHTILPGFPELVPVQLDARSPGVGQTLAALNLRARTGATVLAINRADAGVVMPTPAEVLRAGDVLTLAGPNEAIEGSIALLRGESPESAGESMIALSG